MKQELKNYESPELNIFEMQVEEGIAQSAGVEGAAGQWLYEEQQYNL